LFQEILDEFKYQHLGTFSLDDAYPELMEEGEFSKMRKKMIDTYQVENERQLRDRILNDPDAMQIFVGIRRFIFDDMVALNKYAYSL
jgi:pyoverdine/dityrosine biosynthesis protein Dit1